MNSTSDRKIIVTGGSGFIGSAFIRRVTSDSQWQVLNLDKLTYAGSLESTASIAHLKNYEFVQGDITDRALIDDVFKRFKPNGIIHFAAESHVDRSISSSSSFISTNVIGTHTLLEASRAYLQVAERGVRDQFKFHHISTDEVFGSLGDVGFFSESSTYNPSSPYSASKAASDHLVRSWQKTYNLPFVISNCSNNYGPFQHPEKLIPAMICRALEDRPLTIYGDGLHVRDWIFVDDNVDALLKIFENGRIGESYNVGGGFEKRNVDVVQGICLILDELRPRASEDSYTNLMTFVSDRPGHDRRYALDSTKVKATMGWSPKESFDSGLRKTVLWYLENIDWCRQMLSKAKDSTEESSPPLGVSSHEP